MTRAVLEISPEMASDLRRKGRIATCRSFAWIVPSPDTGIVQALTFHPCGHTSISVWPSEIQVQVFARSWAWWDEGERPGSPSGCYAPCPRCQSSRLPNKPRHAGEGKHRPGPDWKAVGE